MTDALSSWPIWAVVFASGVAAQVLKLLMYSLNRRRLLAAALFQGRGLPSLPGVVCGCLLAVTVLRTGWGSSEASLTLVLAVIVVHDTVKLRGLAELQRASVLRLVAGLPRGDGDGTAAAFLDPRSHHPAHVAVGVALGALFALAFAAAAR